MSNADINDTWLVGFSAEISGVEMATNMLIQAGSQAMAEAAALYMGRTWWQTCLEEYEYRWLYPGGVVWFNSIILLDDVENSILRGLKFLDAWTVTGSTDAPVLRDEWGNDWRDITR
ncbi:hypothetical protein AXM73_23390 [Salmonella enterica subsp. enterica]|nr:hypothetical protein [Salmonella enterica subsp. enterica serovar Hadar]EAW1744814.1 hypothetical protein [Salmonella enterica subsp. enterica]EBV5165204.1 hypothetical protein [Salmonella enterica subsp. enterica serovar Corvallis]EBX1104486.1 hypothetical protein [Salmonella enterica subsp. enterica serovar Anatum]EBY4231498.1 hypothetical protein [Salmonella enterica subsp. enterica serovar Typhimurium]ECA6622138.1 hypothetical protein [Salmonella enterica subsp. enterica serovar Braende